MIDRFSLGTRVRASRDSEAVIVSADWYVKYGRLMRRVHNERQKGYYRIDSHANRASGWISMLIKACVYIGADIVVRSSVDLNCFVSRTHVLHVNERRTINRESKARV